MNYYIYTLYFAIPLFGLLIIFEEYIARRRGIKINQAEDIISSLSSGLTNILRDGLKYTVILISYSWLVNNIAIFTLQPTWLAIAFAFIVQDFSGYWIHRLNHRVNIFWNRHIIHHSSEEFNLSCALRQSISDTVRFSAIFMFPAALLNISPKYFIILSPIHLFLQFWYHTRLIGNMGVLEKILVTPSSHRVHHAINPEYVDKNYGQIFIIWDKLFGTFQKELQDVRPVYGILRQAKTWNPIIINYKHVWQLIKDAWKTERIIDKFSIWFMPTGWRPKDIEKKYPLFKLENVYNQKKYSTKNTMNVIVFSWIQLFVTGVLIFHLFSIIDIYNKWIIFMYAIIILLNIFNYTAVLDGSRYIIIFDIIKLCILTFSIFLLQLTWFGIDGIVLVFILLYFILTFIYITYIRNNYLHM